MSQPSALEARALRGWGVAVFVVGALASAITVGAQDGTFTAGRTYDFTHAVGVRMDLGATAYHNNWTAVKNALSGAKIKYVRCGAQDLASDADKLGRVNELHAAPYGINFDFVFGDAEQGFTAMHNSIASALGTGAVLAFEGPNEWSKHYYQDHDDAWLTKLSAYQLEFKNYLRGNGYPNGPLLCPTVWKRDSWAYDQMKTAGVGANSSVGNLHYYHLNTLKPTTTRGINKTGAYTFTAFQESMDAAIADQQSLKPSTWVTETGEPVATGGEEGSGVTPTVAAKYIPRLISEFYKRGVPKIFIFELLDCASGNYGLLDGSGNQRPAYTSLKNLMVLLDNPSGSAYGTHSVTLSFGGATGINSLVLEKDNGHFYVLLWRDDLSTDTDQTQLINLSWGFTAPSVKTYLPLTGTAAVNTWTNRTAIQANVRDHVLIVEIARPGT